MTRQYGPLFPGSIEEFLLDMVLISGAVVVAALIYYAIAHLSNRRKH